MQKANLFFIILLLSISANSWASSSLSEDCTEEEITPPIVLENRSFPAEDMSGNVVNYIVNGSLLTYDLAYFFSFASSYILEADDILTAGNRQLSILNKYSVLKEVLYLGEGINWVFISQLSDARYFVQAINEQDWKLILYYLAKTPLYYVSPKLYGLASTLESGIRVHNFFQYLVDVGQRSRQNMRNFARHASCELL